MKTYTKPQLKPQGNVEEITQKRIGYEDAFFLNVGTRWHGGCAS